MIITIQMIISVLMGGSKCAFISLYSGIRCTEVRGLMLGVSIFIPHNDHHRVHGGSRVCSMG